MGEPVDWLDDGTARSPRFKDRYSTCTGGLAQALTVFVGGCGLPARWQGRNAFTILETGFGFGLNFLTAWAVWERDPRRCDALHFVSVEAYPVAVADLVRNTMATAHVADNFNNDIDLLSRVQSLAHELAAVWCDLGAGSHDFSFAQGRVRLTLVVGDVLPALQSNHCEADAVFLDGFSPSVNPDMWSRSTLQAVTAHVRGGSTLASYTIARTVRDALQELGYTVRKVKGLPPKRDRLEAVYASDGNCNCAAHSRKANDCDLVASCSNSPA